MKSLTTIFFDITGVCLTNGWNHIARGKVTIKLPLDYEELENRDVPVFKKIEKGKLSINEYPDNVIFFKKRKFNKQDFIEFMY